QTVPDHPPPPSPYGTTPVSTSHQSIDEQAVLGAVISAVHACSFVPQYLWVAHPNIYMNRKGHGSVSFDGRGIVRQTLMSIALIRLLGAVYHALPPHHDIRGAIRSALVYLHVSLTCDVSLSLASVSCDTHSAHRAAQESGRSLPRPVLSLVGQCARAVLGELQTLLGRNRSDTLSYLVETSLIVLPRTLDHLPRGRVSVLDVSQCLRHVSRSLLCMSLTQEPGTPSSAVHQDLQLVRWYMKQVCMPDGATAVQGDTPMGRGSGTGTSEDDTEGPFTVACKTVSHSLTAALSLILSLHRPLRQQYTTVEKCNEVYTRGETLISVCAPVGVSLPGLILPLLHPSFCPLSALGQYCASYMDFSYDASMVSATGLVVGHVEEWEGRWQAHVGGTVGGGGVAPVPFLLRSSDLATQTGYTPSSLLTLIASVLKADYVVNKALETSSTPLGDCLCVLGSPSHSIPRVHPSMHLEVTRHTGRQGAPGGERAHEGDSPVLPPPLKQIRSILPLVRRLGLSDTYNLRTVPHTSGLPGKVVLAKLKGQRDNDPHATASSAYAFSLWSLSLAAGYLFVAQQRQEEESGQRPRPTKPDIELPAMLPKMIVNAVLKEMGKEAPGVCVKYSQSVLCACLSCCGMWGSLEACQKEEDSLVSYLPILSGIFSQAHNAVPLVAGLSIKVCGSSPPPASLVSLASALHLCRNYLVSVWPQDMCAQSGGSPVRPPPPGVFSIVYATLVCLGADAPSSPSSPMPPVGNPHGTRGSLIHRCLDLVTAYAKSIPTQEVEGGTEAPFVGPVRGKVNTRVRTCMCDMLLSLCDVYEVGMSVMRGVPACNRPAYREDFLLQCWPVLFSLRLCIHSILDYSQGQEDETYTPRVMARLAGVAALSAPLWGSNSYDQAVQSARHHSAGLRSGADLVVPEYSTCEGVSSVCYAASMLYSSLYSSLRSVPLQLHTDLCLCGAVQVLLGVTLGVHRQGEGVGSRRLVRPHLASPLLSSLASLSFIPTLGPEARAEEVVGVFVSLVSRLGRVDDISLRDEAQGTLLHCCTAMETEYTGREAQTRGTNQGYIIAEQRQVLRALEAVLISGFHAKKRRGGYDMGGCILGPSDSETEADRRAASALLHGLLGEPMPQSPPTHTAYGSRSPDIDLDSSSSVSLEVYSLGLSACSCVCASVLSKPFACEAADLVSLLAAPIRREGQSLLAECTTDAGSLLRGSLRPRPSEGDPSMAASPRVIEPDRGVRGRVLSQTVASTPLLGTLALLSLGLTKTTSTATRKVCEAQLYVVSRLCRAVSGGVVLDTSSRLVSRQSNTLVSSGGATPLTSTPALSVACLVYACRYLADVSTVYRLSSGYGRGLDSVVPVPQWLCTQLEEGGMDQADTLPDLSCLSDGTDLFDRASNQRCQPLSDISLLKRWYHLTVTSVGERTWPIGTHGNRGFVQTDMSAVARAHISAVSSCLCGLSTMRQEVCGRGQAEPAKVAARLSLVGAVSVLYALVETQPLRRGSLYGTPVPAPVCASSQLEEVGDMEVRDTAPSDTAQRGGLYDSSRFTRDSVVKGRRDSLASEVVKAGGYASMGVETDPSPTPLIVLPMYGGHSYSLPARHILTPSSEETLAGMSVPPETAEERAADVLRLSVSVAPGGDRQRGGYMVLFKGAVGRDCMLLAAREIVECLQVLQRCEPGSEPRIRGLVVDVLQTFSNAHSRSCDSDRQTVTKLLHTISQMR
ncbi:hypothetical protein KIPB_005614, partial [Kipferlia bialata]